MTKARLLELVNVERSRLDAVIATLTASDLLEVAPPDRRTGKDVLALLDGLGEDELHDATRFREMPSDWSLWEVFADNTYRHCAGHLPELQTLIRAGLETT